MYIVKNNSEVGIHIFININQTKDLKVNAKALKDLRENKAE